MNVDATIFSDAGAYSVARIARDSSGVVLEAFSSCKVGQIPPVLAEVIGGKGSSQLDKRQSLDLCFA